MEKASLENALEEEQEKLESIEESHNEIIAKLMLMMLVLLTPFLVKHLF